MNNNTIILNLFPTSQETATLLDTMTAFNSSKNYILSVARQNNCFNKHKLSGMLYYEIRNNYLLPSQLAISAISTVVEDRKNSPHILEYEPHSPVFYDKRVLSYRGLDRANLATTIGRLPIKFEFSRYLYWGSAPSQIGCAILFYEHNLFTLYSVIA